MKLTVGCSYLVGNSTYGFNEIVVDDISPSGNYVKIQMDGVVAWVESLSLKILECLDGEYDESILSSVNDISEEQRETQGLPLPAVMCPFCGSPMIEISHTPCMMQCSNRKCKNSSEVLE